MELLRPLFRSSVFLIWDHSPLEREVDGRGKVSARAGTSYLSELSHALSAILSFTRHNTLSPKLGRYRIKRNCYERSYRTWHIIGRGGDRRRQNVIYRGSRRKECHGI